MGVGERAEWKDQVVLLVGGDEVGEAIEARLRNVGAQVVTTVGSSDLINATDIAELVEAIVQQYGKIDVLVHAWECFEASPAIDMPWEKWKTLVQTNVKSKFLFAKEAGRHMLAAGHGNIVLLTSIAGLVASPGAAAFAASQGAVQQVTRTLGVEWARRGIRVNAVASSLPEGSFNQERMVEVAPLGRLPKPDELVDTVLYLASDASQMVTGQIIAVDGGYVTQ
ncbi:hypothetical protein A8709_15270 [Paenibacillus pectinilyticus]|uniref:SDR family oxidoreductase n=1 Tax=Paenibacillus pectinilyticus TaxID=512399 RepID=A0A1C1A4H1_9BACL|nr:SDR family oxidoreductase [Paenibacillus pectinilyticus]OCT15436.1 hypothetical protein A8709_15270 [Paenibacillus pectinilyticus]